MRSEYRLTRRVLLALGVFLLALVPRILNLNVFITSDELKWTFRSVNFRSGLTSGDWSRTYQVGHPGVVTMWLGALSMPPEPTDEWQELVRVENINRTVRIASPAVMGEIGRYLFLARRGVAVLTAASTVILYFILRRLFDSRVALIAAALIALDPFYLALSRVLHLDGVTTALTTISLLALALYIQRGPSLRYLLLSGATAALAALTKAPALFLAPYTSLLLFAVGLKRKRPLLETMRAFLLWALVATVVAFAVWPALWVDPLGVMDRVIGTAVGYAEAPHDNSNFFWGQIRPDPGPAFYPVAWAFRTTPLIMLGIAFCLPLIRRNARGWRTSLLTLAGWAVLFAAFMTVGAKKFDRYILPSFLVLDIIAAAGLDYMLRSLFGMLGKPRLYSFAIALVLLVSGALALPYHPYYFSYYNPILGGNQAALNTMLVGWGEGVDRAAAYLNEKEDAQDLTVVLRSTSGFAPFFVGHTLHSGDYDPATADYVVIYRNELQRNLDPVLIDRYYERQKPEYVAKLYGIEYAWVFPNLTYQEPLDYIESHAREEDTILLSRASLLAKKYRGDLPIEAIGAGWGEEQIAAKLQEIVDGSDRIWYVKYPQEDPNSTLELVDYQLSTHMFKVEEREYPDIVLSLYQAFESTLFGPTLLIPSPPLHFGADLRLGAFGITDQVTYPGKELGLLLEWEVLQDIDRGYAAFIHLLDEQGQRWGQGDKWLMKDYCLPTEGWRTGDIVRDRYRIPLAEDVPPGEYQVYFGLIDHKSGQRLSISDEQDVSLGDSYILATVRIEPAHWKGQSQELDD